MNDKLFSRVVGFFVVCGAIFTMPGISAAVTGSLTISAIPELRAVSFTDDSIIHTAAEGWNYLGIFNYSTAAGTTPVNGTTITNLPINFVSNSLTSGNFNWTAEYTVAGDGHDILDAHRPDTSSAMHSLYTYAWKNYGKNTLTVSDLVPGEYYTLQFYTGIGFLGGARPGNFSFSTAGPSSEAFNYYSSATAAPQPMSSIELNQNELADTFTDTTARMPVSVEYTFQAQSDTFTFNLNSPASTNQWHMYGLGLAQRTDTENISLVSRSINATLENDGGKLAGSIFWSEAGVKLDGNVNWTLYSATSADADISQRVVLTSGNSAFGDFSTTETIHANLLETSGLDPSFEASGKGPAASPWTLVKTGDGQSAFVTVMDLAKPYLGSYMGCPGQTTNRDNATTTGIIRSGEFDLTGDAISFQQWGGIGTGTGIPLDEESMAGYLGVALRDAKTGEYVAFKTRSVAGGNWQEITFTEAEIAGLMADDGVSTVTLDLIDGFSGGWGWAAMDDFRMMSDILYDNGMFYFLSADGYGDIVMLGPSQTGGSGVPEPATWLMLLAGLAGLAVARRRRSR